MGALMLNFPSFTSFAVVVLLLLTVNACSSQADGPPTADPSPLEPTRSQTTQAPTRPSPMGSKTADLDLRFANVVGVTFEATGEDEYRFSVTLHHDDQGEAPNFADAWRVEDLQGNVLGTRELLHSHPEQPFTRSATVEVPKGITKVIVRGHDMSHGFGGQIMMVDLTTGESTPMKSSTLEPDEGGQ